MNNILNKIAQMERNAEEIKLESHKVEFASERVELASVQELEKASFGIYTAMTNADNGLDKASKEYRLLEVKFQKEFESALKNAQDKVSEFEKAAKELGLDPNTVEKYKRLKLDLDVKPKDYFQMQQRYRDKNK